MIKVFISHQKTDSEKASEISNRLKYYHNIDTYLDIIDNQLNKSGDDLALHIRTEMSKCTQLLAVVSYATRESQWVPWEIGVATEKNFPLATFANYTSPVPEFLRAWPYLRSMSDVDAYANASKRAVDNLRVQKSLHTQDTAMRKAANSFFFDLRRSLGQPTTSRG
ncbi:MAG: toll/interleukin-1 receptor domain-containing protein [Sphingobium sp.]|nr:toll/interleukin-1 receptor domain-containing protein [Sphingobium sp.]